LLSAATDGHPSFNCKKTMDDFCTTSDGTFLNDGACQAWYKKRPDLAKDKSDKMMAWCNIGNNFDDDRCKTFCDAYTGNDSKGYKQQCNALYMTACGKAENKGKKICACLRPFTDYGNDATAIINIPGAARSAACYFDECRNDGYMIKPLEA
jgi:hypothetical protein